MTPIAVPLKDGLKARTSKIGMRRSALTPTAPIWNANGPGSTRTPPGSFTIPVETGKITSGLQLFGNVTFWCFWDNGYQALASLDDNGDGVTSGAELHGLALWHDVNGNGICDPGEVRPLSYHGIVGLSCQWQTDSQHPDRIAYSPRGVVFQNGATRPTFDLILQQRANHPRSRLRASVCPVNAKPQAETFTSCANRLASSTQPIPHRLHGIVDKGMRRQRRAFAVQSLGNSPNSMPRSMPAGSAALAAGSPNS